MSQSVEQITAYVLHSRAYQENSAIIQLFSKQLGRFSVIAKGIKGKRSQARKAILQPFQEIVAEIVGRGELKTLLHCELSNPIHNNALLLKDKYLVCAYYASELIGRALPEHQENPTLYIAYASLLNQLYKKQDLALSLRRFEMQLLNSLGIAPDFEFDVDNQPIQADEYYILVPQAGFKMATQTELGQAFVGQAIQLLLDSNVDLKVLPQAQQITRLLLSEVIGNKPLQSRKMWQHIHLNEF